MKVKCLLDAVVTLPNGETISGPITTTDDTSYLFVNRSSGLDYYMELKKGGDGWYQSGGPSISWPQDEVDQLGIQIDKFLVQNPILNKHSS